MEEWNTNVEHVQYTGSKSRDLDGQIITLTPSLLKNLIHAVRTCALYHIQRNCSPIAPVNGLTTGYITLHRYLCAGKLPPTITLQPISPKIRRQICYTRQCCILHIPSLGACIRGHTDRKLKHGMSFHL